METARRQLNEGLTMVIVVLMHVECIWSGFCNGGWCVSTAAAIYCAAYKGKS